MISELKLMECSLSEQSYFCLLLKKDLIFKKNGGPVCVLRLEMISDGVHVPLSKMLTSLLGQHD